MQMEGWLVNPKRVQRIWRREGLKVPKKQPKRARLWFKDGSCIRLRPEREDHDLVLACRQIDADEDIVRRWVPLILSHACLHVV